MIFFSLVLIFGFLGVIYVCSAYILVKRWSHLYRDLVDKPWGEAIAREDWDGCDLWSEAAASHLKVNLLNPIHWIRYWNWTPEPYNKRKYNCNLSTATGKDLDTLGKLTGIPRRPQ